MKKFRIGRHIDVNFGFLTSPKYANEIGSNVMQIFLGHPQQVISKPRPEVDLKLFQKELEKYDMFVVIHGSYTINFAHPPDSRAFKLSVRSLVQDLKACAVIGKQCLGVIIHMGKNIPANKISYHKALDNYVEGLKESLKKSPTDTTIILETGASVGSEIASDLDGLATIYWKLTLTERQRIGFCIDTCHIWATGYDISTIKSVKKYFEEFDEKIGINKIVCIHFNDSRTKRGSHKDQHADLSYGFIGTAGLQAVAKFAKRYKIPIIMETPLDAVNPKTNKDVTYEEELAKVKKWTGI